MRVRVVIPVHEGVEDLLVSSVTTVLRAARDLRVADVDVVVAAEDALVATASGLRVVPHDLGWGTLADADVLVVPGPRDPAATTLAPALAAAVRAHANAPGASRLLATASTGVLVLARLGLLEGRRVVAPRAHRDAVAQAAGEVVVGPRVLRDGRLVTATGPAAGLDLALRVLEARASADAAARVADALEVPGWAPAAR